MDGATAIGDDGVESPWAPRRPPSWRGALTASLPLWLLLAMAVAPFPTCASIVLLGIPCPGCGLSRATLAGLHLDFGTMFALHPLAPVLTPLVVWVFGKGVLKAALGDPPWLDRLPRVPRWASVTLLVAFVGLWVLRLAGILWHPDHVDPTQGWVWQAGAGWLRSAARPVILSGPRPPWACPRRASPLTAAGCRASSEGSRGACPAGAPSRRPAAAG
jgi:hypothetical protein